MVDRGIYHSILGFLDRWDRVIFLLRSFRVTQLDSEIFDGVSIPEALGF